MWPIIFICLAGCLLAVGSVWLYEIEHVLNASEERNRPGTDVQAGLDSRLRRAASLASPIDLRQKAAASPASGPEIVAGATAAIHESDGGSPSIADEFRDISNKDLMRQALALEAELRASEKNHLNERFGRRGLRHEKSKDPKAREFRQTLLPQAVSLANELLFRLGRVEVPSDVRSLSIKLGEAMIASGNPAGPNPISPVANFLVFLTRKLPQ